MQTITKCKDWKKTTLYCRVVFTVLKFERNEMKNVGKI